MCGEVPNEGSGGRDKEGTRGVSGVFASLRYFFGAGISGGDAVCWGAGAFRGGRAGLRLLGDGGLFLLEADPAGFVEPHVAQHGLGETRVGETGPLRKQRLGHVRHEACRKRRPVHVRAPFGRSGEGVAGGVLQLLTDLNVAYCVDRSVIKWADFKTVLLLNVS